MFMPPQYPSVFDRDNIYTAQGNLQTIGWPLLSPYIQEESIIDFRAKMYTGRLTLTECPLDLKGSILYASWTGHDQQPGRACLNLDDWIGVENGHLCWDGRNFTHDGRHIRLEGTAIFATCSSTEDDGTIRWRESSIDLTGLVEIVDGTLRASSASSRSRPSFTGEANRMYIRAISQPDMGRLFNNPELNGAIKSIAQTAIGRAMEQTQLMVQAFLEHVAETVERGAMQSIEEDLEKLFESGQLNRAAADAASRKAKQFQSYFCGGDAGLKTHSPSESPTTVPAPVKHPLSGLDARADVSIDAQSMAYDVQLSKGVEGVTMAPVIPGFPVGSGDESSTMQE